MTPEVQMSEAEAVTNADSVLWLRFFSKESDDVVQKQNHYH